MLPCITKEEIKERRKVRYHINHHKIKEHMNFLTKQFNTYLNTFLVNNIFSSDENNTVDDVYIRDMTLLFNEFLSILSSLYQFELSE